MLENLPQYLSEVSPLAYVASYLGGVWASLTPCVYPVIPILIGVIGAEASETRAKGILLPLAFVLGMALVYSLLGMTAALTGKIFGQLTTYPAAYLIVGNLCLFFGLSMLDVYHLQLPGNWGKAAGRKKGLIPAFFMGATSGVVAAPCTVPVMGALLAFVAQTRNLLFGFSLLFTFALGLGTLLVVLGTFTELLAALPKSGIWLTRLKHAFGIVLLAVAEFFIFQAGKRMF